MAHLLEQSRAANLVTSDLTVDELRRRFQVFVANLRAGKDYVPQTYPGRVTLLSANEGPAAISQDATMGWGELAAGGVGSYTVPGNHFTMLREPHVEVLAERLKTSLQKVLADD